VTAKLPPGFEEFEFDLPPALLKQLILKLDTMKSATLTESAVQPIPNDQGVYQLLLKGEVVYIGKTDADAGLNLRLRRHAHSIQHRRNLTPSDVTFKAVRVFVFTAMDLEEQLIRHYRPLGAESWNNSGFGSNDPGRERDTTKVNPKGFDARYPIDIDIPLAWTRPSVGPASAFLEALYEELPYTLRVQRSDGSKSVHPELSSTVSMPTGDMSVRQAMSVIVGSLPPGWQATALAGRVILYKEHREYSHGVLIARS